MRLPHKAHLAIVDGASFTLMRNDGSPDSPSLTSIDRPDVEGSNFSAGVRHQDDVGQRKGSTDLNELAHAAAVAEYLNQAVLQGKIDKLAIAADPKTLGEMRRHYHKSLEAALVAEEAKTVTGEPVARIEKVLLSD
ncbi:host attachment protein [Croceicoccus gelatinilyticus]|uniref:baeRF12 domain-containing protein n=1 Tax=Croceicoccus gelatinilyticus TaxID=2835536 RepID=UPI001BD01440|nr:host attachment protein [Croceicoccus gelatinilyticus]MBS7669713.1 host attachment protein [Croceicoccus gelatinilyticus]